MHLIPLPKLVAGARVGIGSTYRWPPGVSERIKNSFLRRKLMIYHRKDLCYGNKGLWYTFKRFLKWSFWNSCGFNPIYFLPMLCRWWQGDEGLICGWDFPVRQILQFSTSEVLLDTQRSRVSSFLCYGWRITLSVIPTRFDRSFLTQPRAHRATFPPGSGARHRLVLGVCVFPPSPDTWGSLSSRQLGSLLCLSSAAAPLSSATRIQLWCFCCQPCWLQQ